MEMRQCLQISLLGSVLLFVYWLVNWFVNLSEFPKLAGSYTPKLLLEHGCFKKAIYLFSNRLIQHDIFSSLLQGGGQLTQWVGGGR